MPPRSPVSRARVISATAAGMSWRMGTMATPARRSGLVAHSSASQRLWARAPAITSGPSVAPVAPNPAPKGADAPPLTASESGKITSPATPSASSSKSRRAASHPPRRPSAFSRSHSSANSSFRRPLSASCFSMAARWTRKSSNAPRCSGSSHWRYSGLGSPAWQSDEITM